MGRKLEQPMEKTKEERLQALHADLQAQEERAKGLYEQRDQLAEKAQVMDAEIDARTRALLTSLPGNDMSRLTAELMALTNPERGELETKMKTLEVAARASQAEAMRIKREIKALDAKIAEDRKDVAAAELHGEMLSLIEKIKQANGLLNRIIGMAHTAGFTDFNTRFERLGLKFPHSLGVLCMSHLSKRNPDTLDISMVAKILVDLGQAYHEKPLAISGQPRGSENIPPIRDNFIDGYAIVGQ